MERIPYNMNQCLIDLIDSLQDNSDTFDILITDLAITLHTSYLIITVPKIQLSSSVTHQYSLMSYWVPHRRETSIRSLIIRKLIINELFGSFFLCNLTVILRLIFLVSYLLAPERHTNYFR